MTLIQADNKCLSLVVDNIYENILIKNLSNDKTYQIQYNPIICMYINVTKPDTTYDERIINESSKFIEIEVTFFPSSEIETKGILSIEENDYLEILEYKI